MILPVRKCYQTVKLGFLFVLVITILTLFEQWRGGKKTARAQYLDPKELEYEKLIQEDEARIVNGLGEGGAAAILQGDDKKLGEESEQKMAMNVYLSDRIAYNRTLKDQRHPACQRVTYDAELPSASVILIFHNEPYSVVVRTIWSVINSARRDNPWFKKTYTIDRKTGKKMKLGYKNQDPHSPFVYLKEIILVDDNSTLYELKGKLSHYVRTRLPPDLIRILRLPDRVGLTRARLAGARYATGDVLVFLDSHCEAQADWLRPLLQEIKVHPHAVVMPIIDVIESSNFYYSVMDSSTFQVGGFTFGGHFTWIDVPEWEKQRRGSEIAPTWSPTMAGGLFAISRQYFWELGAYDEQMAGWGGENLEISFRIWMCGGTLETIPCSRVGHVFRSFHPYGLPAQSDTHGINTARMADVWMDEFADLFYLHRPDLRKNPKIGDITHRKILREKLHCKSFRWYLDNIYKEKFVPVRDVYGFGRFQNLKTQLCLDDLQRESDASPLGLYPCHPTLQASQYLALSSEGELRDEERCAEIHGIFKLPTDGKKILMHNCKGHNRAQKWRYIQQTHQIQHVQTQVCIEALATPGMDVIATACRNIPEQEWIIDFTEDNDFKGSGAPAISELEQSLRSLRKQRRISRSLMSYSDQNKTNESDYDSDIKNIDFRSRKKGKHHKKKSRNKSKRDKPKTKNKFILKIARTLMNNTEEHLEVDIHCKHQQLYPNNTFVRDLVTILNEKNIKVINNGRIFERNKVTELANEHDPATKKRKEVKVLEKMEIQDTPRVLSPAMESQVKNLQNIPISAKSKKKNKHKQAARSTVSSVTGVNVLPPAIVTRERTIDPKSEPKKIIIEDFVEVKPTVTMKPKKKKKHKKKKVKTTAKPITSQSYISSVRNFESKPQTIPDEPSVEDQPMVDADSLKAALRARARDLISDRDDDENSVNGYAQYRRNNRSLVIPERRHDTDSDNTDLESQSRARIETLRGSYSDLPTHKETPKIRKEVYFTDLDKQNYKYQKKHRPSRHKLLTHSFSDSDREETQTEAEVKDLAKQEYGAYNIVYESDSSKKDFVRNPASVPSDVQWDVQSDSDTKAVSFSKPETHSDVEVPEVIENIEDDDVQLRSRSTPKSPIKVIMRSNLTFNLGDEFFAWRRDIDPNQFSLDELSIPSNGSDSDDSLTMRTSNQDAILTGGDNLHIIQDGDSHDNKLSESDMLQGQSIGGNLESSSSESADDST